MRIQPFLRDLRALLASPDAWHPLACVNVRGRILGEFEQEPPSEVRMVPTESVAVAWNLPCAITHVLRCWEDAGRIGEPPAAYALRIAVENELGGAINTTEHRVALAALDAALARFAQTEAA